MDLIPFSLILSNSSTLLAWLCVYLPHSLLLFLLALGSLVSVLAVVAAIALFMRLIALIYLAVDYSFKRPGPAIALLAHRLVGSRHVLSCQPLALCLCQARSDAHSAASNSLLTLVLIGLLRVSHNSLQTT